MRTQKLLLASILLSSIAVRTHALSDGRCNTGNRTDCGYLGITQGQCESKDCCWQPSAVNGAPWCFFKAAPSPACSTNPTCSGHGTCSSGECVCEAGFATCGGFSERDCSVKVKEDVENCGGCGNSCFSGDGMFSRSCSNGQCNVQCKPGYSFCYGSCHNVVSCDDVAPFSGEEIKKIVGYFMNNIDINGGGQVAAATSKQFPNYWYHWARDSALSLYQMMNALPQSEYDIHMKHYVNWAFNRLQNLSCNAGVDVRGEPKFNLDGTCFTDGWMRPQNDAAGLRSITMVRYAYVLLSSGQKDFVTSSMYRTDESQNGIKKDLAYAQQIWNQPSGDPWEEVRGQILFEKLASRRGLLEGAKLADTLGDSAASAQYRKVAAEIAQDILTNHWNGEKGIFMELPNTRELDSATHLGLIYGDFEDGFLDATNEKVQSSISVLIDSFSNNYFQINTKDDEAKIPGILVGRYLNDVYNGGNPQQPKDGNPWILCSASLAEMFYRAARSYGASGTIEITETNANFWKNVRQLSTYASSMGIDVTLTPGTVYTASRDTVKFRSILNALITSGDGILNRIRYHVEGVDFHMAEEINKDNGAPQGAENLTWSYGTVIGAMEARKGALKAYQSLTGSATA